MYLVILQSQRLTYILGLSERIGRSGMSDWDRYVIAYRGCNTRYKIFNNIKVSISKCNLTNLAYRIPRIGIL